MDNLKIAFICVVLFSLSLALIILLLTTMSGSSKCDDCDSLPLWISTNNSIIEINPAEENNYILVTTKTQSKIFDFHYQRKEIYWAEEEDVAFGTAKIYRSWLRDSVLPHPTNRDPIPIGGRLGIEPQEIAELEVCGGLAVDWLHSHVYWADQKWGIVEVAALDGSHRRIIYSDIVVTSIAVDPIQRLLFWMEQIQIENKTHPYSLQIKASNLVGGEMRTIIPSVDWPTTDLWNSVVLDITEQRIYFLEREGRLSVCDYDGRNKAKVTSNLPSPTSVTLSSRQLFWMDEAGNVYTMLKNKEEVHKDLSICEDCINSQKQNLFNISPQLRAVDGLMQPQSNTIDSAEDCLQNYTSFTEVCPCPFGYETMKKSNSCEEEGFLLTSLDSIIQGVSMKNIKMTMHFKRNGKFPDLDFHFMKGLLFWFDADNGRIYKAPMFNLANKSTVALLVNGTKGLAIDWIYDHLYWTNNNNQGGCVEVCKLDGGSRIQLIPRNPWNHLVSIVVNPLEGLMYISNWTEGSLEVVGMDGNNIKSLVNGGLEYPRSLTLYFDRESWTSYKAQRLFWLESDSLEEKSSTILKFCYLVNKESCREVLHRKRGNRPNAMTLFNNRIYWQDHHTIYNIGIEDMTKRLKKMHISGKHRKSYSLRAYHSRAQPHGTNYCQWDCRKNSLCLPSALQYSQHSTRCVWRKSMQQHFSHRTNRYSHIINL